MKSREEAIQKVRDGDVLAAIVIPKDLTEKLQSGLESGQVDVFYNAEDPAKRQFVENTIKSQVQKANAALTKRVAEEALDLLKLISTGGDYRFLGQDISILGLQRAERILRKAQSELPPNSPQRKEVDRVVSFAELARENLSFSDDVLAVVGEPIKVRARSLDGGRNSLSSFAVALAVAVSVMFITLLLAAGTLALEREENTFPRLVRGLVSRSAPARGEGRPGRGVLGGRVPADARWAWGCSWTSTGGASRSGSSPSRRGQSGSRPWAWPSAR